MSRNIKGFSLPAGKAGMSIKKATQLFYVVWLSFTK
jgi:methyl coenzyme M reductase beta subunit